MLNTDWNRLFQTAWLSWGEHLSICLQHKLLLQIQPENCRVPSPLVCQVGHHDSQSLKWAQTSFDYFLLDFTDSNKLGAWAAEMSFRRELPQSLAGPSHIEPFWKHVWNWLLSSPWLYWADPLLKTHWTPFKIEDIMCIMNMPVF